MLPVIKELGEAWTESFEGIVAECSNVRYRPGAKGGVLFDFQGSKWCCEETDAVLLLDPNAPANKRFAARQIVRGNARPVG